MKSDQETFNDVSIRILKQGKLSFKNNRCFYWDKENNTKCAAGVLIPEYRYENSFDIKATAALANEWPIEAILEEEGYDAHFCAKLQDVHDSIACNYGTLAINQWKYSMITFAKANKLDFSVLE